MARLGFFFQYPSLLLWKISFYNRDYEGFIRIRLKDTYLVISCVLMELRVEQSELRMKQNWLWYFTNVFFFMCLLQNWWNWYWCCIVTLFVVIAELFVLCCIICLLLSFLFGETNCAIGHLVLFEFSFLFTEGLWFLL